MGRFGTRVGDTGPDFTLHISLIYYFGTFHGASVSPHVRTPAEALSEASCEALLGALGAA